VTQVSANGKHRHDPPPRRRRARSRHETGHLVRFGLAMDERLLARLDRWVERREYPNRSEAVRDLVREGLVEEEWETGDRETVATISLVYDHHARLLPGRLMAAQHRSYAEIVSALHVHMDADHCLEVLVVRGRARRLRALADRLIATRGVKHGRLTLATTGRDLG
jgi:CopG family transcriptional regulator, nickel-responsive regulator